MKGYKFNNFVCFSFKEFLQSVKKYYNMEPQTVDFQKAADEVRKEINSWVKHRTEGELKMAILPF